MELTMKCPECNNNMTYVKDSIAEKQGFYAFRCHCGEKNIAPKNSTLIHKIKERVNAMDFNEYQKLAMRTKNKELSQEELLMNGLMGLSGEAGEVIDTMKKVYFQGHEFDAERVKDEVGDVLWYVALICEALECDMSEVADMNIKKLKRRYPKGFNTEDSVNR